jgi:hypothetical protein
MGGGRGMGDDTTHSCREVRETAGRGDDAGGWGPMERGRKGGGDDDHIHPTPMSICS